MPFTPELPIDPPEPDIVAICARCGGEMYQEDYVYLFGGEKVCGECVNERFNALTISEKADLLGAVSVKANEVF